MSLDKNLFTLHFTQHQDNPNIIDLIDPSETVHYRKQRVTSPEYKIEVYDPTSESLLAIATSPSPVSKVKTLELYNPTSVIELKYTGTLSFRWSFKWEDHDFEWKREECFMIRKPDPPVIVAVTRESPGRLKTQSVQILDYNLNRFDINDRKGLEIVILTALLTFQDANEAHHNSESNTNSQSVARARTSSATVSRSIPNNTPPPPPPPKPAPKTGIDRIAELQAIQGEYNEIVISEEGTIQEYGEYCNKLLEDDAMLFITVKCSAAEHVPKVLQVVEETKRIRHKAGLSDNEELHQYVLYDTEEEKKGPRRIKLDDEPKNKYAPPKNLTVHLSKISMPELQPKGHAKNKPSKDSKKEDKKDSTTSFASSSKSGKPTVNSFTETLPSSKPTGTKLHKPSVSFPNQRISSQPPPLPSYQNKPPISSSYPPTLPHRPSNHETSFQNPGQSPSFPMPYGGTGSVNPPPPPHIYHPQPLSPTQNPRTSTTAAVQGASAVVQGLMDKLLTRR